MIIAGVILTVTWFSNRGPAWLSSQEVLDKGLIPQAGKILEMSLRYNPGGQKITIDDVVVKNGYTGPAEPAAGDYTIKVFNTENKVLNELTFNVPAPDSHAKEDSPSHEEVGFVETMDWLSGAAKMEIIDSQGVSVASKTLENIRAIDNKPQFELLQQGKANTYQEIYSSVTNAIKRASAPSIALAAGDGYLDIVFVGDRYPGQPAFERDIGIFTSQMGEIEPFKSRKEQIRIWHIGIFNGGYCNFVPGDSFPDCDRNRPVQDANTAAVPSDKIVTLINNDGSLSSSAFGGMSVPKAKCCAEVINWRPQNSVADSAVTFVHEMGHLISMLADEYEVTASEFLNSGNCYEGSSIPNPAWRDLVAEKDYRQRCGRSSFYRPYEISIMDNTYTTKYFNAPSQVILNRDIDTFTGPFVNASLPNVSISSPTNGQTVSGTVNIAASAADDLGITRVNFLVDGELYHTEYASSSPSSPAYDFTWDSAEYEDGTYELEVRAYDVSSTNNFGSAKVTVVIGEGGSGGGGGGGGGGGDANAGNNIPVLVAGGSKQGSKTVEVAPGTYYINELPLPGWTPVSASCVDEDGADAGSIGTDEVSGVQVADGKVTTCTFENKQAAKGKLKIIKKTIGADDTFQFHVDGPTLWDPELTTQNGEWIEDQEVIASVPTQGPGSAQITYTGTYTIDEIVPDGWEFTSVACSNSSGPTGQQVQNTSSISDIVVMGGEGQITTCTFENKKEEKGQLQIVKETTAGDGKFEYFFGFPYEKVMVETKNSKGQTEKISLPPADDYNIIEYLPEFWTIDSAVCKLEDGTETGQGIKPSDGGSTKGSDGDESSTEPGVENVTIELGKTTTCTFTNSVYLPAEGTTEGSTFKVKVPLFPER